MRAVAAIFCLAFSAAAQEPRPMDARCREAAERYGEVVTRPGRTPDGQKDSVYGAGKEYLGLCGDNKDSFTRAVRLWVSKYEAAVRRFEAGRDGGALGVAAGEGMMKRLTEAQ